jgi:hypothetical protein
VIDYPLQPLRIPCDWLVSYNTFCEVDPSPALGDNAWMWFKEDLLQMFNERRQRLLDLGWYPDGNIATGEFGVVLHVENFHGQQLHSFRSRDRLAVVAEIERLLADVSDGRL